MKIMLPLEKMFHCDSAQSKQISKKNSDIKAAWQKGKHQHLHRTLFDASLFFGTHVAGIIPFHWNSDKNSMKTWLTTWEVLIYFSRCTIVRNCAQSQLYAIVQLCNCADTEQKESVQFTLQSVVSPRKSCPKEAPSPCWWLVMNSIIHYNVSPSREGLSWSALKKSIKRGGTPPTPPQRTIFWPDFHQSHHAISPKFKYANATTPFHHCHIDQYPDTDLFILIIEGRNWRSTQTWPNKFTCISSEIFHHSN